MVKLVSMADEPIEMMLDGSFTRTPLLAVRFVTAFCVSIVDNLRLVDCRVMEFHNICMNR
jgi:hypothetical protein